jgi:nucleoid-associated protein YgaU
MKTQITMLTAAAFLLGCSSVSEKIPTVKISKRTPTTTIAQNANFVTPAINTSIRPTASPKEAASVCETDVMRSKVVDGNDYNDSIRIMVVQDGDGSSQLLSELEINCRDYFLRKSVRGSSSALVQTSSAPAETETLISRKTASSRYTYIVQRGDTVWDIARQHCTSVKAISRLNGLGRGNIIDIGQRLKLPDEDCN